MSNGVHGFTTDPVSRTFFDTEVQKEKPGSMKGKKIARQYTYPTKKELVASTESTEKKRLGKRKSMKAEPLLKREDIQRLNEGFLGTCYRQTASVFENARTEDFLEPTLIGVDSATGAVSHAVSLGIESHKLSRLVKRRKAFKKCEEVANRWKDRDVGNSPISISDLKDYSRVAVLKGRACSKRIEQLKNILSADRSYLSSDYEISRLVDNLIPLAGDQEGSHSSALPKKLRGRPVSEQLAKWQERFNQKGVEYVEGTRDKRTRSLDGTKLLKMGHQSKQLMRQFNAIVKPLGIHMNFSTPLLNKIGESALASQHEFAVDFKQFYDHLKAAELLPAATEIKDQIIAHEEDALTLKQFADYECSKIEHQKMRVVWTAAALLLSSVPIVKMDYGARSSRESLESIYRFNQIAGLDMKKKVVVDFLAKHYQQAYEADSLRSLLLAAYWTIEAKQVRARIKMVGAVAQHNLDFCGAFVGSLAGIYAPGVGGFASDVAFGCAKMTAAISQRMARLNAEFNNPEFGQGRIETKVYSALKNEYHNPGSLLSQSETLVFTSDLFDISKDQARLLFEQSDDEDLVSNKQLIRLRFTNGLGGKQRPYQLTLNRGSQG